MAQMPLIRMEAIRKVFFTDEMETHALSDVHLEIQDGEFVEVMGPSGCGKSTLLSLVGLLDTPTEGEYWLDGEPVAKLTASERARVRNRHIGFIFQAFNLIGDLTVYENVELPLTYRGMSPRERKERAEQALERVLALDAAQDLLDRDVVRVDMRMGQRPTVQMSADATETWWQIRAQMGGAPETGQ